MRTKKRKSLSPQRQKRNKVNMIKLCYSFLGGTYKRSLALPAVFRYECLYIIPNVWCFVKPFDRADCKPFVNDEGKKIAELRSSAETKQKNYV